MTQKLQKTCACGTRVLRTNSSLNPHLGQISSQFAGFLIRSLRKSGPKLARGTNLAGPRRWEEAAEYPALPVTS